ncbi:MAG: delta-60 repeat domain-containing protein [Verrucomicrobiae bacterium]|nr:delta-60 repeat domain-containing protein [Verrucomicrobiae bacterium]
MKTRPTPAGAVLKFTFAIAFGVLGSLQPGFSQAVDGFSPQPNAAVYGLAVEPDGQVLVSGNFTAVAGQPRRGLARLNSDGSLDTSFDPSPDGFVETMLVLPDGKIMMAGSFLNIGGQARQRLARLGPDGSVDALFNPGASGAGLMTMVHMLALQSDGRILVGGRFTALGGQSRTNLGRMHPDGTVDAAFRPVVAGSPGGGDVLSIVQQQDGRILIGGWFTSVAGQARVGCARLNLDGTLDVAFNPAPDSFSVYALAVQPNGRILIGGGFTRIGGLNQSFLARLETDGVADPNFNPSLNGAVKCIALQADGKILIGGAFTNVNGQARPRIARLNPDGSLDPTFNLAADSDVEALTLQPDGAVLLAGIFSTLNGQTRPYLGRVTNPTPALESFEWTATGLLWRRGGAVPEVEHAGFEFSQDQTTWALLGPGRRTTAGWEVAGIPNPALGFCRARALVANSGRSGSWLLEMTTDLAALRPRILTDDDALGFAAGRFGFNVASPPGRKIVLEASTNLLNWLPLATNVPATNCFRFFDPDGESPPMRFYRARLE